MDPSLDSLVVDAAGVCSKAANCTEVRWLVFLIFDITVEYQLLTIMIKRSQGPPSHRYPNCNDDTNQKFSSASPADKTSCRRRRNHRRCQTCPSQQSLSLPGRIWRLVYRLMSLIFWLASAYTVFDMMSGCYQEAVWAVDIPQWFGFLWLSRELRGSVGR